VNQFFLIQHTCRSYRPSSIQAASTDIYRILSRSLSLTFLSFAFEPYRVDFYGASVNIVVVSEVSSSSNMASTCSFISLMLSYTRHINHGNVVGTSSSLSTAGKSGVLSLKQHARAAKVICRMTFRG